MSQENVEIVRRAYEALNRLFSPFAGTWLEPWDSDSIEGARDPKCVDPRPDAGRKTTRFRQATTNDEPRGGGSTHGC